MNPAPPPSPGAPGEPHRPGASPAPGGEAYLWDGTGAPDPTVQRLEEALEPARWRAGQTDVRRAPSTITRPLARAFRPKPMRILATAAGLALGCAGLWIALRPPTSTTIVSSDSPSWQVTALAGAPKVNSDIVRDAAPVRPGQWLTTDATSRASLAVADIGHVTVEPDSRMRLIATGTREHRLELARGTISAFIAAPPRIFLVQTPAALAVDLGCIYTLTVAPDGSGRLAVQTGLVELQRKAGSTSPADISRVPAGAVCLIDPSRGPGTPHDPDAPAALTSALAQFDRLDTGAQTSTYASRAALDVVLAAARPADAVTLWHLLARVNQTARARVVDALQASAPAPADAPRSEVLRLDAPAVESWWRSILAAR